MNKSTSLQLDLLYVSRKSVLTAALILLSLPGLGREALANTGVSDNAPGVEFYLGLGEDCCGEDPHPVHGIETADGGYAVVGKSIDSAGEWNGFIVKVHPENLMGTTFLGSDNFSAKEWSKQVGSTGKRDGLNNLASNTGGLFAAGFIHSGDGTIDRYLVKYDPATGNQLWEATFSDPIRDRDGAIESVMITKNGGLVVTGVINAARGNLEGFKSYGNPSTGEAFVAWFSAEQLNANTPPSAPVWTHSLPDGISGKGIREVSGPIGGYVVVTQSEEDDAGPSVHRLSSEGEILWSRKYAEHGEATDIAVLKEGRSRPRLCHYWS